MLVRPHQSITKVSRSLSGSALCPGPRLTDLRLALSCSPASRRVVLYAGDMAAVRGTQHKTPRLPRVTGGPDMGDTLEVQSRSHGTRDGCGWMAAFWRFSAPEKLGLSVPSSILSKVWRKHLYISYFSFHCRPKKLYSFGKLRFSDVMSLNFQSKLGQVWFVIDNEAFEAFWSKAFEASHNFVDCTWTLVRRLIRLI